MQGRTLKLPRIVVPLADAAATRHKSPSKFLIATKTHTTVASPQKSASMSLSASDFTMDCKRRVP
jgi:hypothetical protein